jgi:branched-chain amino acid transport system ATP-binding protein
MLTLMALSRRFGGLRVIEDLDLTVEAGEILGILGPNGAGKSTLFNLIAGVLPPSGGRVLLDGRDITTMKPWDRSRIGIGRTYQIPKPFSHMTVFENVLVAAVHGGKMSVAQAKRECAAVLHRTGLTHRTELAAGQLGLLDMKQLELAKALAVRPRLLLLDEIAGGLTEPETDALLGTIREVHAAGTTIIWVEHIMRALTQVVQRVVCLADGRLLFDGTPQDMLRDEQVQRAYLGGAAG